MPAPRPSMIRASEIGEYLFCSRAWWLRHIEGVEPHARERLEHGVQLHRRHGQAVAGSRALLWVAGLLLLGAALALLVLR